MYNTAKLQVPCKILQKFSMNLDIHLYNTRKKSDFHIKRATKNVKKLSTNCQGIIFWNWLPANVKESVSLSSIKSKLKKTNDC